MLIISRVSRALLDPAGMAGFGSAMPIVADHSSISWFHFSS